MEHRLWELTVLFVNVLSVKILILVSRVSFPKCTGMPLCSSVGLETALPRTPSNRKEHDDEAGALQWVSGDRHPVPHLAPARGPLASHLTSLGYSSLLKEKKKSCDSGPQ